MLKNVLKYFGWILAILIVGYGALYGIQYYQYRHSDEYKATKYLEDLQKQYAEDTYGGNTPEETLQLFIGALKKGDTDLASKYFVIDEQEKSREYLVKVKGDKLLDGMIQDLEKTELTKDADTAYFTLVRKGDLSSTLVMHKNSLNNKWKITEL